MGAHGGRAGGAAEGTGDVMLMFRHPARFVFKAKALTPLERIVDRLSPKMRRAVQSAARTAQGRIDLAALSGALERGRIGQVLREVDVDQFTAADLAEASKVALEARVVGAALGADSLRGWALDVTNPEALAAAERQAAALVTLVNEETKQTIRDLVARAYREQVTAADTARLIRDVVGLNERQATALFNYRAGLVESGMAEEKVARMAAKYGDRLLRDRASTIAQTEIHRASAEGQHELWRQGVREGRINPATARRYWISNVGACDWCVEMEELNADGVTVDGQFQTPDGDMIDGPEDSHVNCRCSSSIDLEGEDAGSRDEDAGSSGDEP